MVMMLILSGFVVDAWGLEFVGWRPVRCKYLRLVSSSTKVYLGSRRLE
jgi:hypothetical protein